MGRVLVAPGRPPVLANQLEKRDVDLDVVPRDLLFVAMRRNRASTDPAG